MDYQTPKTFDEYLAQFPDFYRKWLSKHCRWLIGTEEFEDAAQHLMLETIRRDRIAQYDSSKRMKNEQRDTPGLFLSWMGRCFRNDMNTLHKQKTQDKRRMSFNTISLDSLTTESHHKRLSTYESEILSLISQTYAGKAAREGELILVNAQIAELHGFIAKHRPELLPAINNLDGAGKDHQRRIRDMARHMENGTVPCRPYKPKRRRKPRYPPEEVAELAAQGLTAKDAAAILGCHPITMGEISRRCFGTNWKGLVTMMREKAADA